MSDLVGTKSVCFLTHRLISDILDDHDGVGTDIPVLGDGFMLFGKPVNYLKVSK